MPVVYVLLWILAGLMAVLVIENWRWPPGA